MFDLTAIQAAIRAQGLNGWLLADFRWVAGYAVNPFLCCVAVVLPVRFRPSLRV